MQSITYTCTDTPEAALAAFSNAGEGARFIAGGTTLYDLMKLGIETPAHIIDVSDIDGFDAIETEGDTLRIGAMARMADVAVHPVIRDEYPVLAESLLKAASQQIRNMAMVGGNLLQRTRCIYFRNGAGGISPCNKREPGSGCAAIGGLDRGQALLGASSACTAVFPGDWPVALIALGASVDVLGLNGRRTIPVAELYRLPGDTPHIEFSLTSDEIVTAITVPKWPARRSTYHKIRDRESYAFALVSAAVVLEMQGNTVLQARVALGGVASIPWRATEAETALVGHPLTRTRALAAGRAAFANARPGQHNAFKLTLGPEVIADALMIAAKRIA
ncbi:xanthine dehydrogenase family protein subunit M [Halomonas sp. QX-2]|uniref:Xanthine dehydrogenase family protein subunit M n=1 Tax=Vreelandella sedimenti TaxID=2729618 RepID=A0A7Z0SQH0_9GAMM|nr:MULTISPECIES: xanthine dehydrogenase family protein subunit M [Halomonas]NYT73524.1 xanthine dehydrogenase family protein subunit M [Halomonas sedimenti]|tara:strand:- start:38098 stop:39096 length:999 start_codon:yes stop_codon:yes gene_type:complete